MAGNQYTTKSIPVGDKVFNGGLNSTSGPLNLQENESSDLQNIDFDKFGSILKRNGYACLNTSAMTTEQCDGLYWFEYFSGGNFYQKAVAVADGKFWKMDDLDGTWDNITGALTITSGYHCDFETFMGQVFVTNGIDAPFKWDGGGNGTTMTVPTGLTSAKFIKLFNNYLFLANVTVSGVYRPSRIYWCALEDPATWDAADFIEVARDDGQEITGMKVLSDRLVIYKTRSIYTIYFTGDADVPFILPGGGKTNSQVGCCAPFSIQDVDNGHVFLAMDGLYFFDGNNSYKLSYRLDKTFLTFNHITECVSLVQKTKNRYWLSVCDSGSTNNKIIVWDYFNNAFSIYTGIAASALCTFYVDGTSERPYFGDYDGYVYRADTGTDDYPLNSITAINAYYYTNWKLYDDLCDQKGIANVYIYFTIHQSVLTFAYSYDFDTDDQYTDTFTMDSSGSKWDAFTWDVDEWAKEGGDVRRWDLTGRGRVVRFKFANANKGETFRIDGFGSYAHLETNV